MDFFTHRINKVCLVMDCVKFTGIKFFVGPSTAVGLADVVEEESVPNLRKSSTAPVPVSLLGNLQVKQYGPKQKRTEDDSSDDEDVVFPMTDIFGRVRVISLFDIMSSELTISFCKMHTVFLTVFPN